MRVVAAGSLAAILSACPDPVVRSDTGSEGPALPVDGTFSVVAEEVEGGVFLSAWSDGEEAVLVGGDLLGAGGGLVARYDGVRLCTEIGVAEGPLWWIHGAGPGAMWMVGEGGIAIHEVAGVRTRRDVPTDATLYGVYDRGDEVWAVGGDVAAGTGEVWVRRDGAWRAIATDLEGVVFKVWRGWIVGDGVAWTIGEGDALVPVDAGGARLLTVRGDGEGTVWAVGGRTAPILLAGDVGGLDPVEVPGVTQPLNGVWTGPGAGVWIAGNFGTTVGLVDGEVIAPDLPVTAEVLHAAWRHRAEVLFVGGSLLSSEASTGIVVRYGRRTDPVAVSSCGPPAEEIRGG